ncbi:hypothetical protein EVAR_7989_1 [Eumeta japonica]|uniref:Uncharacterized protein n=1 Tax=Eumeta variegata TaxID=151549 RepID=A0A4C1TK58_EUMVA|nr:hypothetical protein EVAR_7989_1 [Eumeta japonica]
MAARARGVGPATTPHVHNERFGDKHFIGMQGKNSCAASGCYKYTEAVLVSRAISVGVHPRRAATRAHAPLRVPLHAIMWGGGGKYV